MIGVDIGGTKTALLVWDVRTDEAAAQETFPTPTESGPEALIASLADAIDGLLAGCARGRSDLRAVGVAVPGVVDVTAGRVLTAGNLDGWTDVPLRDLIAARLGVPVAIEHDAHAAALGERWRGAARDLTTFAFVAPGRRRART